MPPQDETQQQEDYPQQQYEPEIIDQECEIDDDRTGEEEGSGALGQPVYSPKVNKIRGLTPQNRLMSSQKMEQDSVLTDNMLSAIQATTVGSKD